MSSAAFYIRYPNFLKMIHEYIKLSEEKSNPKLLEILEFLSGNFLSSTGGL